MDTDMPFIKSVQVNKVRHLTDFSILIDDSRPRHLILTGPNGCGKSSLLSFLRQYLEGIPNRQLFQVPAWKDAIISTEQNILSLTVLLGRAGTEHEKANLQMQIANAEQGLTHFRNLVSQYESVVPALSALADLSVSYQNGGFLISYFEAKRFTQIQPVSGAQRLDLPKVSQIVVPNGSGAIGSRFLQFLVNQENRAALLGRKGEEAGVKEIETWLTKITEKFRELFENDQLTLEYDIDNFDFTINIPGREPFRLVNNELSDGFSAVLQIVTELLMRMEAVTPGRYDTPGIVLIDEIETHLHIRLQKAILPFLTGFFPNIQFIVTTHSPFVLTSLSDAVVFDLESKKRWENMAPMSVCSVVENYFDLDPYSHAIQRLVSRYEALSQAASRTEDQDREIEQLRGSLDNISYEDAPEIIAQYKYLRAKESSKDRF